MIRSGLDPSRAGGDLAGPLLKVKPAMRTLLTLGLATTFFAACDGGPAALKDPPILKVTSPDRGLLQGAAGIVTVKGTVTPNASGALVDSVLVNTIPAVVGADGSFIATVQVEAGATLIQTIATDNAGGKASDTRSVRAGQIRKAGANIDNAIQASISTESFAKISEVASTLVKGLDIKSMLAPMNPMQHAGDPNGEDCLFDRAFVDDFQFSDVHLSLVPVVGGIEFSAEIDGLNIPAHVRYAVACVSGTENISVAASKVIVAGTLVVTPNGMNGFTTKLQSPNVDIQGLDIHASGLPGTILNMIDFNAIMTFVGEKGAELAMGPIVNKVLGGLAGPKTLDLLGKTMTVQVSPSAIEFDDTGALVSLNTSMLIAGSENSPGFVFTDNGLPNMDPSQGFQLGLADDLMNEMMAEVQALGMLNMTMAAEAGSFDGTAISMSVPPMVSADPADGKMKIILGDMTATFMDHGTPVGRAAINAKIDLAVVPANNGYGVAVQLGTPSISVDVLDDVMNTTRFSDEDLSHAVSACLNAQIASISKLLTGVPIPEVMNMRMKNLSIGADSGYVMVKGALE